MRFQVVGFLFQDFIEVLDRCILYAPVILQAKGGRNHVLISGEFKDSRFFFFIIIVQNFSERLGGLGNLTSECMDRRLIIFQGAFDMMLHL